MKAMSRHWLIRYRVFEALFCGFAVASAWFGWHAVAPNRDPREPLVASPAERHLGLVRQGTKVSAKFELRNASPSPIEIGEVKHTCTCTSHSLDKTIIAPGAAAQLIMEIDTKYRRDKVAASSFVAYRREGEHDNCRELVLEMIADIDPGYDVEPKAIVFRKGERGEQQLRLVPQNVASVNAATIQCDRSCFAARSVPAELGRDRVISVSYDPKKDFPDNQSGTLTIHTDSPNGPVVCVDLLFQQAKELPRGR